MNAVLRLVDVGPRDGLQNEKHRIPAAAKIAFIDALSQTGIPEIEVGAFVSPRAVPQMADSGEVFENIRRKEGVVYSALVPNEKGFDAAMEADVDKISIFTAASESFNKHNIKASIAESIERFKPVITRAKQSKLPVRAYISTAFHCPYEGRIKPEAATAVCERLMLMGVDEISVGDTIGRASPMDVRALMKVLVRRVPVRKIFLHFHDTYGLAIANALTAWQEFGITGFDASTGGLGGCPYAPGASGNVAMEDLIFAFQACGAKTGVELLKVKQAAATIACHLDHPLHSRLSRVDLRSWP